MITIPLLEPEKVCGKSDFPKILLSMVTILDLDDTLYRELAYVKSGFQVVASFLARKFGLARLKVYQAMLAKLKRGRGKIFDDVLKENGLYSNKLGAKCVSIYRCHEPKVKLYDDADRFLTKFRKYPLYIVTDGNKLVQKKKVFALKLNGRVKRIFFTRDYGLRHEKPSPYCFLRICRLEKIEPREAVYIADNPRKDFIGLKPLGFKTVRILRGNYKNLKLAAPYEGRRRIKGFGELWDFLN